MNHFAKGSSSSARQSHSSQDRGKQEGKASSVHSHRNPASHSQSPRNYWDVVLGSDMTSLSLGDQRGSESDKTHRPTGSRAISKSSPSQCAICKSTFTSLRSYDEHKNHCGSSADKPYKCRLCGTAFRKNSNLTKHVKMVHLGEREHACPEPGCGRMFGQKSNLSSHIRAVHYGEKPFECPETGCSRRFSQKSGLKGHIRTVHYGDRPYVCGCGSAFGHSGDVSFDAPIINLVMSHLATATIS